MRSSHPIGRTVCGAVLLVSTAFVTSGRPDQEARRAGGPWDPESGLGNHRAVVRVETASAPAIVRAVISWRRRDFDPEKKDLIVVDATTGARIKNILALAVNREIGDIVFEPQTIPGEYYVYYMPFKSEGRKNYPNVKYDPPAVTADPAWIKATGISPDKLVSRSADAFPRARVVEIQSADEFSAFTPMERIATAAETAALLAAHPGAPYLIFPEDRSLSVRMKDDIPWRWAATGPSGDVSGEAARGEFFTFQIGVWAARQPISDLEV
ncbi:MAG TPA: glycoside hydrolase domain-containing protein, partial [Acidobacteriota bacterium]|nr:glycoside hydrolase domain-containing protein [Acidobacteriota bacterium]